MRSLFEKNLMRMKQELTDLKSVHERGLGTVEFFRYRTSFSATAGKYYSISGTIATGEPGSPIAISLTRGDEDLAAVSVSFTHVTATKVTCLVFCRRTTTATVDIISSSALNGIAKE